MANDRGGFIVRVDATRRLIEVTYPQRPTSDDVAHYRAAIKRAITEIGRPWDCLVDQRPLSLLPPELVSEVTELNAYAERHGMRRSARVVATAVATLQSARIARNAELHVEVKTFTSIDPARAWLASAPVPQRR